MISYFQFYQKFSNFLIIQALISNCCIIYFIIWIQTEPIRLKTAEPLSPPRILYFFIVITIIHYLNFSNKINDSIAVKQSPAKKEAEEKILWRYEKEFYSMDESGHSLAEQAFSRRLETQIQEKKDFWQKIPPSSSFHRKVKHNPFNNSETTSTSSIGNNISTDSSVLSSRRLKQSTIQSRQTNRVQILKLRKTINQYKNIDQSQSKQRKKQKFSVMHMYKKKKTQESLNPTQLFSQTQNKVKQIEKLKFQYPQTIFVREVQYFSVPMV